MRRRRLPQRNAAYVSESVMTSQSMIGFRGSLSAVPLPTRFRTRLRYSETATFTTGAVGIVGTANLWRLNSLFDPNQTGVGHQPYGFDSFAALYAKYLVRGARWVLTAMTPGASADVYIHCQVGDSDGFLTIVGLTPDAAIERSNVSTAIQSPSGNNRVTTINGSARIHQVAGVSEQAYVGAESLYSALVTANPAKNYALQVAASSPSGAGGEAIVINFFIEYDAEFFEPIGQAQS